MVLCIFRGPYCPIEGGDAPRATGATQAFGLGRALVGCVSGDTLRASHKRDGQLRPSWHMPAPSAGVPRHASRHRREKKCSSGAHISRVGISLQSGWASSTARLGKKPYF